MVQPAAVVKKPSGKKRGRPYGRMPFMDLTRLDALIDTVKKQQVRRIVMSADHVEVELYPAALDTQMNTAEVEKRAALDAFKEAARDDEDLLDWST